MVQNLSDYHQEKVIDLNINYKYLSKRLANLERRD